MAFQQAGKADDELAREARRSAERAAEAVASRLATEDVDGSMAATRAETILSFLERRLLEPSESVTIWNPDAVVVFAEDKTLIGTQDRRLRTRISRVLSNGTQTDVTDGSLHTFVPVPVGEGEGTLVMAEVIRPDDEVSSAGRPWIYASVACGLLAFLALAAALRRSSGYSRRSSVSFGAGDLRRERTSRLKAEKALDRAREEEIKRKAELERVVGELRETKEALSSKDASIGEAGSKIRAAEEQAARAEAELRAGANVRDEAARLIESELAVARSELASIKEQSEKAQRELDAGRAAQAELEQVRRSATETEGKAARAEAEAEQVRAELADLQTRAVEAAARAERADARVERAESAAREAQARAEDAEARAEEASAEGTGAGPRPSSRPSCARLRALVRSDVRYADA